jgi:CrcB protein
MGYLWRTVRRVLTARWDVLLVIAGGGAFGSLARWELSQLLPPRAGAFPWATFTANMSGCLLMGVLMVFVVDVWPPSRYVRPFLGVGVLGGYTTFSTYMLDTRGLLVSGHVAVAGEYVFGSLLAGLAAVWLGLAGARLVVRSARRRRYRQLRRVAQLRRRGQRRTTASIPPSTTRSTR